MQPANPATLTEPFFLRIANAVWGFSQRYWKLVVVAMLVGPFNSHNDLLLLLQVLAAFIMLGGAAVIYNRAIRQGQRKKMLALFALHEMLVVLLFPLVLTPFFAWVLATVLFVIPLIWFAVFNRAMYGTFAAPDV